MYRALFRFRRVVVLATLVATLASVPGLAAEPSLKILSGDGHGRMMQKVLFTELDRVTDMRNEGFTKRTTTAAIDAHHRQLRAKFIEAIGGLPKPGPLNAQVTGTVKREGFTVEKVIFESRPNHHITAALFLPANRGDRRVPGVLIPCGHAELAKADAKYQKAAALLALNGMAALLFDPIDQGERMQIVKPDGSYPFWGTKGHLTLGVGCIFLGNNTAQYMIFDGMRAIDYLQSRPEIDPERIGCMGNSGGGTQTAYLAALDDRVKCASPSCYITSFPRLLKGRGGQDSEQTIYGQLAWGMDHADYLTMRVPTPQLVCTATADFFDIQGSWDSFRQAKRVFSRFGHAERLAIIEHDGPHGYAQPLREAATRWMARWLLGEDRVIREPEIEVLTPPQIQVTPRGQVMLLDGEKSVYDLNGELLARLTKERTKFDPDRVRELAGVRPLSELRRPDREEGLQQPLDGKVPRHLRLYTVEPGVRLPVLLTFDHNPSPLDVKKKLIEIERAERPARPKPKTERVLFLHERGKTADLAAIKKLYDAGHEVMAVDLRGTGETLQTNGFLYAKRFGSDGLDVILAYLLGKSYVGMRTEDILVCARELGRDKDGTTQPVRLIAHGHVTVPALHAAALEPELFADVELHDGLASWSHVIAERISHRQLINFVHGCLSHYDLPDLVKAIRSSGREVTIHNPTDAMGRPLTAEK